MCKQCYPEYEPISNLRGYRPEDEEEVRYRKGSKAKAKPKTKGCPVTGGKAHVYVWIQFNGKHSAVEWRGERPDRYAVNVWTDTTWWERRCIGCDHLNNRKYSWGPPPTGEIYEVRKVDHNWW
jgi:hypothetical protein